MYRSSISKLQTEYDTQSLGRVQQQEVQVQGAWDELDGQGIDAIQFVDKVKYRIGGASYRNIQKSDQAAATVANPDKGLGNEHRPQSHG